MTATELLGAAVEILVSHGYTRVVDPSATDTFPQSARLFEDPYGIVAVVVYETWAELVSKWPNAQESLVNLISRHVSGSEAKAWEGYLVLLTPAVAGIRSQESAHRIRYDTTRVRKFLATGEELTSVSAVEQALLPLLPLDGSEVVSHESTLELLPELLTRKGIPRRAVEVAVKAYLDQASVLEKLHAHRGSFE